MENVVEYSDRYFAFVDILGFSNLIRQSERGALDVDTIQKLLTNIHRANPGDGHVILGADLRAQSISDAVAISASLNENGLLYILHALKSLAFRLLEQGYFVRGALVHGNLMHDEQMVFGPALLDAYRLESSVAKFPRIMISRSVVQKIAGAVREEELRTYIAQAADGPYNVNVLQGISRDASIERQAVLLPHLEAAALQIDKRLNEATDNPNHFEKVQWFARFWNSNLPEWTAGTCTVKGPGLEKSVTMSDVAGYIFALS